MKIYGNKEDKMTDKILNLCAKKWVENCGISAGVRALYWDMAWEMLDRENRNISEFEEMIKEIDKEALAYDIAILDIDDYRNVKEEELEYLTKEEKEIFLKGWEIFEAYLESEKKNLDIIS